jgi:ribosomal protein S18 acetylase RimI-like enzyme
MIRPARPDEFPRLAEIEDAAEALFEGTHMAFVRDMSHAVPSVAVPAHAKVWVSVDSADIAQGFLEAEPIEGWLHILELSVHPAAQQQGRARALVDTALAHARESGLEMVSLTTDRTLPFNAPMYARMEFAELPVSAQPDWLGRFLAREVQHGFDPALRVAMARRP